VAAGRNGEERAVLLFALHTGARASEQLAIEWHDIDFEHGRVHIRRSFSLGAVVPPKSGHERTVPLSSDLADALRAVRHDRSTLVFCNEDGAPLSIWQLHDRLGVALRRAGLRRIRWHDLRHTFASQLVTAGVPLMHVQRWLGHSSIEMTIRYAHLAPGEGDALIHVLDGTHGNGTATWRQRRE
jgi:integrase